MVKKTKTAETSPVRKKPLTPPRDDKRRPTTTYMEPDLLKSLKLAAIEDGTTAYEMIEEAVRALLKARKQKNT
jgi:hypothetical protein